MKPLGRWSLGHRVRLTLARELPSRFVLRIDTAMALQPNVGVDLVAGAGGMQVPFRLGAGETVVELPFQTDAPGNVIEILIPNPRSPKELEINLDKRQLGIALRSITILPQ